MTISKFEGARLCVGGALIGSVIGGTIAGLFSLPISASEWKGSLVGFLVTSVLLFFPRSPSPEVRE